MGRAFFALLLLGLLAAAAGSYAVWAAWQWYETPQQKLAGMETLIEPGDRYTAVLARWKQAQLIERPLLWRLAGRLSGLAPKIQAGEYRLAAPASPRSVLEQLSSGAGTVSYEVQLLEGWTLREIRSALSSAKHLRQTLSDVSDASLVELLARTDSANARLIGPETALSASTNSAEGWLFPDTYRYQRGATDLAIMRRAFARMLQELRHVWENRAEGLPLKSPYEVLTLASIVEKETGQSADREFISQVFVRRLQIGMKLQTDPTVIYGVGAEFAGDLTRKHLRTDTPYNSYTRFGLPPTPIASPGRESLQAAVSPAPTDYLFFVARGDGTTQFSRTLEEHNAAVRRFQLGQ